MVQVKRGRNVRPRFTPTMFSIAATLITCDPAMCQLLRHLDKTRELNTKFIVQNLDDTHLIVDRESTRHIKTKIDEHLDKLSPDVDQK